MKNFIPKGMRRKSSGNVLEEPDKPSFRVISRDEVQRTADVRSRGSDSSAMHHGREQSYDDEMVAPNRGSNGSSVANSTRFYDTSSSARHSSTSTLPSTDLEVDDLFSKRISAPGLDHGRTSSLTGFANRFPFNKKGAKGNSSPTAKIDGNSEERPGTKDRSLSSSSYASTAQPPTLNGLSETDFGSSFGDLFGGLGGQRKSAVLPESSLPKPPQPLTVRSGSDPALPPPSKAFAASRPIQPPSPVRVDRGPAHDVVGSPYSWASHDSGDRLMASPDVAAGSPVAERAPPAPKHSIPHIPMTQSPVPMALRPGSASPAEQRKSVAGRQGILKPTARVRPVEDEDARMVRESFRASRGTRELEAAHARMTAGEADSSEASLNTPSLSSASSSMKAKEKEKENVSVPLKSPGDLSEATPRGKAPSAQREEEEPLFGHDPDRRSSTPGVRWAAEAKQPQRMTMAEFGVLKRQELKDPIDDDTSDEEYLDEDQEEDERKKMEDMRRIRQEQQEKMSAHREMMKRTTGGMNDRPSVGRHSNSTSALLHNRSFSNVQNSEDDDDEDIPLAILQAHNFPKTHVRPASATGVRPASAAESSMNRASNLPPFARGLPSDVEPFLGANLVQQPMRESIGYGAMGPGSAHGGSSIGQQQTLVNMIADAEQAKEARRGGSSKIFSNNNTYGQRLPTMTSQTAPQMAPQQMPMQPQPIGQMGQMGQMGPMAQMGQMGFQPQQPMMDPQILQQASAQNQTNAQIAALTQSMQQLIMIHMQGIQQQQQPMQQPMMQQMMQQPMMQPAQQNNFLSPNQRPVSMGNRNSAPTASQHQQRTRSMVNISPIGLGGLSPQQPGSHLQAGYAASLAPSERSNVGRSPRYRPVSTPQDGSSTVMSNSTVQPIHDGKQRIKVNVKPPPKNIPQLDSPNDDEDEEGWGATATKANKWGSARNHQEELSGLDIPAFE
ncbi:uncharacterized protein K452DRAFT_27245 [Aplosporella prunicola CBS 121167]|uniref:Uncharacterized protein n=1 Tax=Aplosporella prunicola CBS 121167 TaxID=1176127 RepID=A0A6A6BD75_9PEZI|nr:uncharacterized protein K452DRAFT_27245 [Aplosporella prunicola CBS 121167]KAF2142142.1 hypothetical protein K452DRAFT_27245 [Aplosporella prunicola CBS 121167]